MNKLESPEINLHIPSNNFFRRVPRLFNGKKQYFLRNDAWKTVYPDIHTQENEVGPLSNNIQK